MVPPNILLNNWESDWLSEREHVDVLLIQAYQAGADAELDECCNIALNDPVCGTAHQRRMLVNNIRTTRRPKSSNLKEQSIALLDLIQSSRKMWQLEDLNVIRQALEQLSDDN